mmetsp:Transcript_5598/g.10494  ORF Transcript_5598/g.10494 Transcript_5598/m.10494 type:complete len:363 (-) Transcript_5598:177-1265(-)
MAPKEASDLVVVDYHDLENEPTLLEEIEKAFGEHGYGVIGIRNVPGFLEAKQAVLSQAHDVAHLPAESLEKLESPEQMYNAGWSHGKEKLGDKPDFAKGSFYFNPLTDTPGTPELQQKYPGFFPNNVWPTEELPEFEPAAKKLGKLMHQVVVSAARHIDAYAASVNKEYKPVLEECMSDTEKANGRLLYYFPLEDKVAAEGSPDSWIGWHNDSSFLTCLAGDMYVNDETGEQIECPDPEAGLYVEDHNGDDLHVHIPEDCMAVQLGECVTIVTGGAVKATPHCVRGAKSVPGSGIRVSRVSHPLFLGPMPSFPLKVTKGSSRDHVLDFSVSPKVPDLSKRWVKDGQSFGSFQTRTFAAYTSK